MRPSTHAAPMGGLVVVVVLLPLVVVVIAVVVVAPRTRRSAGDVIAATMAGARFQKKIEVFILKNVNQGR